MYAMKQQKQMIGIVFRGAFALLVAGIFVWGVFVEPEMLTRRRAEIVLPGWKPEHDKLKIAVLSDFHCLPTWSRSHYDRIVAAVEEERPDLIVLLGDFVNATGDDIPPERLTAFLKRFRAPLGVYAVLGNHEFWYGYHRAKRLVEAAGIPVLENSSRRIEFNGAAFRVAGTEDFTTGRIDFRKTFDGIPEEEAVLLLTHNPDAVTLLPPGKAALTFAGHTHGGQVRLPWIGTAYMPEEIRVTRRPGMERDACGNLLFLTGGLGTTTLPIRWNSPPEIGLVVLRAAQGQNDTRNATK